MALTLLQRERLRSLRRINIYFSILILSINLFFGGFNLYSLVNGILLSFLTGFAVATIEVFLFPSTFQRMSFLKFIILKSFLYLFLLLLLIVPLSQLLSELYRLIDLFEKYNPGHIGGRRSMIPTDWRRFPDHPVPFLRTIFIYLIGCLWIVFINQFSRIMGPGVLSKLITGRYYSPVEEKRIFMFLDLKSSTSIAERLDNMTYSHFIRDVYFHIGEPILRTRGEIYQYVGDEVVISWLVKNGNKQPPLCLECFWRIEETLNHQRPYYEKTYGIVPRFKAGLHYGPVIATFVGDVKRELVYHGDVMNTAARIQEQCNPLHQKLLLSDQLRTLLDPPPGKCFVFIGNIMLKGKQQEVGLYTVKNMGHEIPMD